MRDLLLELSQNPQFRKLVKTTGLPLPMPPQLARGAGGEEGNPYHLPAGEQYHVVHAEMMPQHSWWEGEQS